MQRFAPTFTRRALIAVAFPLSVLILSSAAHAINLVVNGEFENPAVFSTNEDYNVFDDIPGWDSTTAFEVWRPGAYTSPNIGSDGAGTGQHLELTPESPTVISQVFVVPADQMFAAFSFDWWPREGDTTDRVSYSVTGTISGALISTTTTGVPSDTNVWNAVSHSGLAIVPGETITLSFTAGGGGSEGHIDQVVFDTSPIPEPVSVALVGLGALILFRRRFAVGQPKSGHVAATSVANLTSNVL